MKLLITLATVLLSGTTALAQQANPGAHFIENWDLDSNSAVSAAEIAEKRSDVFASFDADENGSLSAEEYVLFDEARANDQAAMGQAHGKGMKNMEAAMELGANDQNADGAVSAEEFASHSTQMFAQLDKNADGAITAADFGMK